MRNQRQRLGRYLRRSTCTVGQFKLVGVTNVLRFGTLHACIKKYNCRSSGCIHKYRYRSSGIRRIVILHVDSVVLSCSQRGIVIFCPSRVSIPLARLLGILVPRRQLCGVIPCISHVYRNPSNRCRSFCRGLPSCGGASDEASAKRPASRAPIPCQSFGSSASTLLFVWSQRFRLSCIGEESGVSHGR